MSILSHLRSSAWLALLACTSALAQAPASGPASAATAPASVADPYLFLESFDSEAAMAWVRTENKKTLSALEADPRFEAFHTQALAIAQTKDRIPMPTQIGGRLYNFWQDAEHVRGLWRVSSQREFDAGAAVRWTAVLDLDQLAATEKSNWVWGGSVCEPGQQRRCLLSLSDGGEDAVTVREFDLPQAKFVAGGFALPKGKQRVVWRDADTLLVAREWAPGELTTSGYPYVLKALRRGQPLAAATEVFRGKASDGGYGVEPQVLTDARGHRAVLINRPLSTFASEKYIVTAAGVQRLALPLKADVVELFDGQLLVRLGESWQAGGVSVQQGSLVSLDLAQASASPQALRPTIVFQPGPRESLAGVTATRSALVVATLDNVRGRAAVYTRNKRGAWSARALALPDNSTVRLVDADPHSDSAYLSVAGYLLPSSLWRGDSASGKVVQVRSLPAQFDAAGKTTEQFEATSTDGVKIPYFIVHPSDMALDGSHPTILYAYGGFEASLSPTYSGTMGKLWLENGGVYVVANIRGGGEFGPAWHEAGLKTKRQIIYDDFAAVAQDLIARKVTSPRRLGIMGGSNGGLLMGVEMTQRPELWTAVDIQVPLLDMLRYEQIAAGTSWVGEYGSVSVPEEREFLARISPYHQLRPGVAYPRALVWTTTKDDRVGPQHARKFAARLSEYKIPYYFYEVIEGGHGAGANLKERAHTSAIEYTYFSRQLMGP